jgi:hypothetical protein
MVMFFDKSRTKVGLQCFANKASSVSRLVSFDWYYDVLCPYALRVKLKQALFKYPSSAVYHSVPGKLRRQIQTRNHHQPSIPIIESHAE